MTRLPILRPRPAVSARDAAIDWIARETEGRLSADDEAGLEAWLAADPAHPAIYEGARRAVGAPELYSAQPEMMDLRRQALASLAHGRPSPWRHAALGGGLAAGLAAVVVLGVGWMGLQPNTRPEVSRIEAAARTVAPALNPDAAIYRTRVGERSSVTLPDGSVATLNTGTVLKVAYRDGERGVRLVRGQALFQVARNTHRPFRVYAADRQITAVGTTFDVRLDGGRVRVALVEGVVNVARDPDAGDVAEGDGPVQQVVMAAGEVLDVTPASTMTVQPGDAAASTSWRAGLVSFRAASLADAVAEMNRYTETPIAIADPSIAGYRITGVFRTGDPARFAQSVTEVLPVAAETGADGTVTLVRDRGKTEGGG